MHHTFDFLPRVLGSATPRQLEQLKKLNIDIDQIYEFDTVSEFDAKVTVPVFGYTSLEHYYSDSSNDDKIGLIHRPFLCLTALDDPFVPGDCESVVCTRVGVHVS